MTPAPRSFVADYHNAFLALDGNSENGHRRSWDKSYNEYGLNTPTLFVQPSVRPRSFPLLTSIASIE
jgi:hypothetical protein